MKITKLLCGVVVVVAVLCSVPVPKASAQLLSNKWFKMKFSGKGFVVNPTTGDPSKATFSLPVYAQFLSTSNNPSFFTYSIHLWTDTDAGWSNSFTTSHSTTSTNNNTFFSDFFIQVFGTHSNNVSCYHTPLLSIKTDRTGAFKGATYQGIGEILNGAIHEDAVTNKFFGSFSLTGTTVESNKLPFTAP